VSGGRAAAVRPERPGFNFVAFSAETGAHFSGKCSNVAPAMMLEGALMRANPFRWLMVMAAAAALTCLGAPPLQAQVSGAGGAAAQASQASDAKVEQLLKASGYTYTTHSPNTWSVEFDRKSLGKFRVIISTGSDLVVSFAILAKKAAINKTPKLLETLVFANNDYDYAKIGLDKDGDLFVRIDSPLRLIDADELKSIIGQVANASDELFAKVSGSIKK
jgi:Putative bacterial sensory transduction regulator